ncbi:hypothetical protein B5M42_000320 [Paenibacillus athensensis]|uniref:Butirosin biosynthesis protein H N-terminal domain-containing protein n=1 Tax=Paenibacillus athensensis TaxID=1967502 RepID=A0A4Y8Q7K0_9BACL|nr:BtrH N-terminal domain-containing protein [Paenibacillus athensensis]MCD1257279.1 hypothetical protein [Paenibacillus athensensis]
MFPVLGLQYTRVDAEFLDCVSDNLAVLLDFRQVADLRSPFACEWHFEFRDSWTEAMPLLARRSVEERIQAFTGRRVERTALAPHSYREELAACLARGEPALLLGDAYYMPWLPYFGREHQEHSFVIDGIDPSGALLHIVDAYENQTEWGGVKPLATYVPAAALERIVWGLANSNAGTLLTLSEPDVGWREPDLGALLRGNAEAVAASAAAGMYRQFAEYCLARLDSEETAVQLVLACWFATRARSLHRLWLSDLEAQRPELLPSGFAAAFYSEVEAPWRKVSEFAYLMLRRVKLGKTPPATSLALLAETVAPAEARLADALLAHLGQSRVQEVG